MYKNRKESMYTPPETNVSSEKSETNHKRLKILHYYWTQYNDLEKPGGGVRVYLENIIGIQKQDNDVYMLNSGVDYDFSTKCYIKELKNKDNVKQYSIVNSPIMAPSKCSFNNQYTYINDLILTDIVERFLNEQGPFDVIHFHSLEGLSVNVLSLKEKFPKTKFILSLHNYYPFCPQVNLWKNDQESCADFHCGKDCVTCIPNLPNSSLVKCSYILSHYLRCLGMETYSDKITKKLKQLYGKYKTRSIVSEKNVRLVANDYFEQFRSKNVKFINQYIDKVICVSKRVREIAIHMGINADKCQVLYIGTKFADNQMTSVKYPINNGILKILYMGYMRRDKGFYFFLDSLQKMPEELAKRIEVVVAARFDDMNAVENLNKLNDKYYSVNLYNGYTHKEISVITDGVNLGIVPVIWEDNLPQVAMEMKAMGIPVLASDRGGASELTKSELFRFRADDQQDFFGKLSNFINCGATLDLYYKEHIVLKNSVEHYKELKNTVI